jgi:DNA-binding transcriptional LysR family regulator
MEVIEKFRRTYPEVEIATTHFTSPTSEDFDMIIDSRDDELTGYNKLPLLSEGIQVAMISSSPFAGVEELDVRQLSNEPFVTLSERSSLYHLTNSSCRDHGFKPRIAIQSDDPFYVRKCVELGLGLCMVPKFSWKGQFTNNVVLKDVRGYLRHTYIFTDPKKHLSLCSKRFIEMLMKELGGKNE